MVKELENSELVQKSPLGDEFVRARGFSAVFNRSSLGSIIEEVPYLERLLDHVLFPSTNAVFVNPLILSEGSRVDSHVDCRLLQSENVRIIPTIVSVLYVEIDSDIAGGELVLNPDLDDEVVLVPRTNMVIQFRGDVVHRVRQIDGTSTRISLVCEQYNFQPTLCWWASRRRT